MTTAPQRPFRFGVQLSGSGESGDLAELSRTMESLGYDVATLPDHFSEQLAPLPAMMAMAAATSSLRVGALVFDNDYKHPVVLAKELATIDVLSAGRVEIGIGAGWMKSDYDQSGIAYDPPGVRVDRFEEGLAVIKGAMAEGPFSFTGEHYTITDYDGQPLPVQRPHPPILIGGGGPRVLSIAAREADIIGINATLTAGVIGPEAIASMTEVAVDEKVAVVRRAAGDRLIDIELNIRTFFVSVTDDRDRAVADMAAFAGVDDELIRNSPFAVIGTPDQIADDLLARRDRWGFSYITVGGEDVEPFAPVVAALTGR
ncbi:MAG: TIGR03621 family F420-dependent LLM class oxidoreductase [Actinomycetota bacterium]|nr:TIGR03621 family F420-dependent LLM class oxidoreductase [Actinomycetota bacterium]